MSPNGEWIKLTLGKEATVLAIIDDNAKILSHSESGSVRQIPPLSPFASTVKREIEKKSSLKSRICRWTSNSLFIPKKPFYTHSRGLNQVCVHQKLSECPSKMPLRKPIRRNRGPNSPIPSPKNTRKSSITFDSTPTSLPQWSTQAQRARLLTRKNSSEFIAPRKPSRTTGRDTTSLIETAMGVMGFHNDTATGNGNGSSSSITAETSISFT